jgi:outer membrane autotransporter protein
VALADGGTLYNAGTISGGSGGSTDGFWSATHRGDGGVGLIATGGATIVNSGAINGGLAGDYAARAAAVRFSGGGNTLTLENGYSFVGNVISTSGTAPGGDTLVLGGDTSPAAAFDVSRLAGTLPAVAAGTQYVGFAGFEKTGISTWTLTGSSSYGGPTNVLEGTLLLDSSGSIAMSAATVHDGARLGGIGTAGAVTVASGGIFAPGNPIGTIHAGTLDFEAGGIYEVELKDGGNTAGTHNDLTIASDVVTIGADAVLNVKPENGTDTGLFYVPGLTYTVIQSTSVQDEGVVGRFGTLTDAYLYLDFIDIYDSHNVYLTSRVADMSFCLGGLTANQCAAAEGVQDSAPSPMFIAIVNLTDPSVAGAAFDGLSGEIHASAKTALIDSSHFVRDAINERLRAAFDGVGTAAMPVLAYGETGTDTGAASTPSKGALGKMSAAADAGRLAVWGSVFGSWGSTEGDGNAAGLDRSTGGFLTGLDGLVTQNVRLGILAGYSHDRFDVDARAASGSSDNYHLGLYGGTQWGALGLRSGLSYSWHKLSTGRSVAFTGFTDRLDADYDAGTFQAFGELGYRLDMSAASFEPFANLAHVHLRTGAFTEKGGAATLTSPAQTTDTTFTTLGLRASAAFDLGGARATARGMVGWKHAFGDTTPLATHAFAGSSAFTVAGAPIARDAAVLEAGLDFAVGDNATLGIAYNGQIASKARDHGAKAEFSIRF